MDEQESIRLTADNIKALAHPLRVQVLGLLRVHGPATASELATRLGLTSGALSYHLRQLARFGFIVDEQDRGNRRDRYWRASHRSTEYDASDVEPTSAEAGLAYEQGIIAAIHRSLLAAHAERPALSPEWQHAFTMSDVLLRLTPEEASELAEELMAVLVRYPRHTPGAPAPEGTRLVEARFQVFPTAVRGTATEGAPA